MELVLFRVRAVKIGCRRGGPRRRSRASPGREASQALGYSRDLVTVFGRSSRPEGERGAPWIYCKKNLICYSPRFAGRGMIGGVKRYFWRVP